MPKAPFSVKLVIVVITKAGRISAPWSRVGALCRGWHSERATVPMQAPAKCSLLSVLSAKTLVGRGRGRSGAMAHSSLAPSVQLGCVRAHSACMLIGTPVPSITTNYRRAVSNRRGASTIAPLVAGMTIPFKNVRDQSSSPVAFRWLRRRGYLCAHVPVHDQSCTRRQPYSFGSSAQVLLVVHTSSIPHCPSVVVAGTTTSPLARWDAQCDHFLLPQ